jgi:zinc protease
LAVVGKFDADYEKLVEKTFSNWDRRTIQSSNAEPASFAEKMEVKLYIKKGLQQSQIRLSQIGIDRLDKDFLTLRLGNEILGGGFASRLNQKVRDDLGLTYSISSYFDVRKDKGSFDISTFSKNESAGRTFDETLKVVNEFVTIGASEYEVNSGKSLLIGQFPRTIETSDRLAFNFLILEFYGIPFEYLTKYNKNINSLDASKVNAAMKRHLDPLKFKAVIYGNESIIPQFQKYQPEVIMLP